MLQPGRKLTDRGEVRRRCSDLRNRWAIHRRADRQETTLDVFPIVLEGQRVRLEPLSQAHQESLIAAASDGELWNSAVTIVPSRATVFDYIQSALDAQARGRELPFVIVRKASDEIVGSTRFRCIEPVHRRSEIGSTWLSASAQRTVVNTEAKLLLLTHAFEAWRCNRIEFLTDVLNHPSRAAIFRLGAKQEGVFRNHMLMPNGRIRDSVCFSIIAPEWPKVKARLMAKLERKV